MYSDICQFLGGVSHRSGPIVFPSSRIRVSRDLFIKAARSSSDIIISLGLPLILSYNILLLFYREYGLHD